MGGGGQTPLLQAEFPQAMFDDEGKIHMIGLEGTLPQSIKLRLSTAGRRA